MTPRFHYSLRDRLTAFFRGIDLHHAPINTKGGCLRAYVSELAHSPVFGMEVISGHWWAHTTRGWWPLSWYQQEALRERIPQEPME